MFPNPKLSVPFETWIDETIKEFEKFVSHPQSSKENSPAFEYIHEDCLTNRFDPVMGAILDQKLSDDESDSPIPETPTFSSFDLQLQKIIFEPIVSRWKKTEVEPQIAQNSTKTGTKRKIPILNKIEKEKLMAKWAKTSDSLQSHLHPSQRTELTELIKRYKTCKEFLPKIDANMKKQKSVENKDTSSYLKWNETTLAKKTPLTTNVANAMPETLKKNILLDYKTPPLLRSLAQQKVPNPNLNAVERKDANFIKKQSNNVRSSTPLVDPKLAVVRKVLFKIPKIQRSCNDQNVELLLKSISKYEHNLLNAARLIRASADKSKSSTDINSDISQSSKAKELKRAMEAIRIVERIKINSTINPKTRELLPYSLLVYSNLDQFRDRLIPQMKRQFCQQIADMYLMKPTTGQTKIYDGAIVRKVVTNRYFTTITADIFHHHNNKDIRNDDFFLINYFDLEKNKEWQFVAYKTDSNDFCDAESPTFTLTTPRTDLFDQIKKSSTLHFLHTINMSTALKSFRWIHKLEESPLIKLYLDPYKMEKLPPSSLEYSGMDNLDPNQYSIIMKLVQNNVTQREKAQITVIDGCTGSGKSRIIIKNIIIETLKEHTVQCIGILNSKPPKMLVFAKNIGCIDEITEALENAQNESYIKFDLLHLGPVLKANDNVEKVRFINKARSLAEQQQTSFNELSFLQKKKITDDIFSKCQVVLTTLSCSDNKYDLCRQQFDIIIIDEATKCLEADMIFPIYLKPSKLILIGDTCQPGFDVQAKDLIDSLYGFSFIERILKCKDISKCDKMPVYHLRTQYRMNTSILRYPNQVFYSNKIHSGITVLNRSAFPLLPFGLLDLNIQDNSFNDIDEEIDFVMDLLKTIEMVMRPNIYTIGVITVSMRCMWKIMERCRLNQKNDISIDTINNFISEKDVIILYIEKTEGQRLMCDPKRFLSALTRARHSFWVCVNLGKIERSPLLDNLIANADRTRVHNEIDMRTIDTVRRIIKNRRSSL